MAPKNALTEEVCGTARAAPPPQQQLINSHPANECHVFKSNGKLWCSERQGDCSDCTRGINFTQRP